MKQATVPRKSTEENLEELTKELKELVAVLKSVRGTDSLLVETPDQYAARLDAAENERSSTPQWKTRLRTMLVRIRSTFK
jgi:anion-transporting  ArsA/GET3 family ATPase